MNRTATTEKRKTRLIDIAEKVGVSKAAVASVLTNPGRNNIKVSQETSEAIRRVARELNYTPNLAARTLAGRESMVIGALVDSYAPGCIIRMLGAVEKLASDRGYRLMVGQAHDDVSSFITHYQNFSRYNTDGVLCFSHEYPGHEEKLRTFFRGKRGIVYIDKPCIDDVPYVKLNRETGSEQAVQYLCSRGATRIGLLLHHGDYQSGHESLRGYRRAMESHNLEPFESLILPTNPLTPPETIELIRRYINEVVLPARLQGVLVSNDFYAGYLIQGLCKAGLRCPGDVAVIGHDNDDFCNFFYPAITSIDQKAEQVAQAAFDLMMEEISSPSGIGGRVCKVDNKLVIRESSEINIKSGN